MVILTNPLVVIPVKPDELANLLNTHSNDWQITLMFLANIASKQGIKINIEEVEKHMKELIG